MSSYTVEAILKATDAGFSSVFGKAEKRIEKFENFSKNLGKGYVGVMKSIGGAVVGTAKYASIATGIAAGASLQNAGELRATEAQFNQAFSGLEKEATGALDAISKETSILPNRIKKSFSQIAAFAKVAGMDTAQALSFTERATMATADAAAFLDMEFGVASDTLKSYLKGNFNVADSLGILCTETTRNAKATELFGKKYKDLDGIQQQEVLLQMFEDANKVSGAFGQAAREGDGWENVLGNLKQSFVNLSGALGNLGLDYVIELMKKGTGIIDGMAQKVNEFGEKFNSLESAKDKIAMISKVLEPLFPLLSGIASAKALELMMPGLTALPGLFGGAVNGLKLFSGAITGKALPALGQLRKLPSMISQGMSNMPYLIANATAKWPAFMRKGAYGLNNVLQSGFGKMTALTGKFSGAMSKIGEKIPKGLTNGLSKGLSLGFNTGNKIMQGSLNTMGLILRAGLSLIGPAAIIGIILVGLGLAYQQFGGQIDKFINLAVTKGPQIIQNLANGIASRLPGLINSGVQMLQGLTRVIQANLPALLSAGGQILQSLLSGVMSNMPTLIACFVTIAETLLTSIASGLPKLLTMGMELLHSLVSGIVYNLPMLIEAVGNILNAFISSMGTELPKMIEQGRQTMLLLVQGVSDNLPQFLQMAISAITGFINNIVSNLPALLSAGIDVIMALVEGILSNLPTIIRSGVELIMSLVKGLGQALPTIIAKGIELIGKLIITILQHLPDIIKAGGELIMSLGQGMLEAIPQILTAAWDAIKNGFNAVKDFILGKNEETVASTESTYSQVSSIATTKTAEMGTSVQGNIDTMALNTKGSLSELASMGSSVFSQLQTDASVNTADMSTGVGLDYESMNLASANAMASIQSTTSTGFAQINEDTVAHTATLVEQITANYTAIETAVNNSMDNLKSSTSNGFEGMSSTAEASMEGMSSTIESQFDKISQNVKSKMDTMANSINSGMIEVKNSISSGMTVITNTFQAKFDSIGNNIKSFTSNTKSEIRGMMQTTSGSVSSGMSVIRLTFSAGFASIIGLAIVMNATIVSTFNNLRGQLFSSGYYAGMGLYSGLAASSGSIYALAASIAYNVASTIRRALQVHSPSRVLTKIGQYTGQGLYIGMESMESKVKAVANDLAIAAIPKVNPIRIGSIGQSIDTSASFQASTSQQPQSITLNLSLGGQRFRAFVDDITMIQDRELRLERAY